MLPIDERFAVVLLSGLEQDGIAAGRYGERLQAEHRAQLEAILPHVPARHQHAPVGRAVLVVAARPFLTVVGEECVVVRHQAPAAEMGHRAEHGRGGGHPGGAGRLLRHPDPGYRRHHAHPSRHVSMPHAGLHLHVLKGQSGKSPDPGLPAVVALPADAVAFLALGSRLTAGAVRFVRARIASALRDAAGESPLLHECALGGIENLPRLHEFRQVRTVRRITLLMARIEQRDGCGFDPGDRSSARFPVAQALAAHPFARRQVRRTVAGAVRACTEIAARRFRACRGSNAAGILARCRQLRLCGVHQRPRLLQVRRRLRGRQFLVDRRMRPCRSPYAV